MQGNVFTVFMEDEETKEWGKLNKNNKWIFCLSERKQIKKFLMSNLFSPLLEWRGFYRDDNLSPSQAKSSLIKSELKELYQIKYPCWKGLLSS